MQNRPFQEEDRMPQARSEKSKPPHAVGGHVVSWPGGQVRLSALISAQGVVRSGRCVFESMTKGTKNSNVKNKIGFYVLDQRGELKRNLAKVERQISNVEM